MIRDDDALQSSKKRALIVDDDDDIRDVISDVLKLMDFDVITADSADSGLTLTKNDYDFDLIILDYRLPQRTGGELIRDIRAQQPKLKNTPTLLLSGDRDIMDKAKEYGVSAFLPKPPDLNALMREVRNLVN